MKASKGRKMQVRKIGFEQVQYVKLNPAENFPAITGCDWKPRQNQTWRSYKKLSPLQILRNR